MLIKNTFMRTWRLAGTVHTMQAPGSAGQRATQQAGRRAEYHQAQQLARHQAVETQAAETQAAKRQSPLEAFSPEDQRLLWQYIDSDLDSSQMVMLGGRWISIMDLILMSWVIPRPGR